MREIGVQTPLIHKQHSINPGVIGTRDDREAWIRAKYDAKDFLEPLPESEFPIGQV
jgi:hypothetical protein